MILQDKRLRKQCCSRAFIPETRISNVDSVMIVEIREMVSFELGKEIEIDVFLSCVRQRENSESPWGIKPQAFGFRAPMLYHWATETPQWARSIMKLIWHASCILLYEIGNRPLSPWSFCDSVVGHRSAESEGLSFDSSLGRRIFPLSHARDKTKNIFLYHLPHINYIHYLVTKAKIRKRIERGHL